MLIFAYNFSGSMSWAGSSASGTASQVVGSLAGDGGLAGRGGLAGIGGGLA